MKSDTHAKIIETLANRFQVKDEDPAVYDTGRNNRYQIDSGNFARIATMIMEDLMIHKFTLRQRLMVDAVIRMTYGYSRKSAIIKPGLFSKLTGLARQHCHYALKELVEANVLKRDGHLWQYNKYADKWLIGRRENVTKTVTNGKVTETVTKSKDVTETVTNNSQKCNRIGSTTKESIKERKKGTNVPLSGKPDDAAKSKPKKAEEKINGYVHWKDDKIPMKERWVRAPRIGKAYLIMEYLNGKAKRNFQALHPDDTPNNNAKLIFALFDKKYTGNQICDVIDDRVAKWGGDDRMKDFLRPATLFRMSNFVQYFGQLGN